MRIPLLGAAPDSPFPPPRRALRYRDAVLAHSPFRREES